jgi:outer membrane lipoprotein carrier protein
MIRVMIAWLLVSVASISAASPVDRVVDLLGPYQQFSAEFTQSTLDAEGQPVSEIEGRLAIQTADVFFWQTEAPFAQQIVADGEVVWIYDEDLFQVQVRPLSDALGASPAAVLGGDPMLLNDTFRIQEDALGELSVFRLIPRAADEVTRQIELRFDGSRLLDLQVVDALGNRTRIRFTSVDRSPPAPAQFEFTPPQGVDVIYALGESTSSR